MHVHASGVQRWYAEWASERIVLYVYVSSPLLAVVTHTVSVSARIRHYRNTNATKGEVGGGGSLGVWGTGYRNKTWMLGTNTTSEGGRYRGVFV